VRFESLILAQAASEAGGRLNILGAGITRFSPPQFPWQEPSLTLVVRARLEEQDFGEDHTVEIRIVGPEGSFVIPPLQASIPADALEETRARALEGELQFLQFVAGMSGVPFATSGVYEFVVNIDGEEVTRYPVVVAPPPD
jgi:hypothetical protein